MVTIRNVSLAPVRMGRRRWGRIPALARGRRARLVSTVGVAVAARPA